MFEHVVLRRAEHGDPISIGEIVEALLYYQRVHVVIDRGTLFGWVKQVGPDQVLSLLRRSDLSAVYCEEMLGTRTEGIGPLQIHNLVAFTLAGHDGVGRLKNTDERLAYEFERLPIDRSAARRFTTQFLRRVPVRKLSGSHFVPEGVSAAAKRDLLDAVFVKNAVRRLVSLAPCGYELGEAYKFDIIDTELGMYVFHDIDIEGVNARRAALSPTVEPLTIAYLLIPSRVQ